MYFLLIIILRATFPALQLCYMHLKNEVCIEINNTTNFWEHVSHCSLVIHSKKISLPSMGAYDVQRLLRYNQWQFIAGSRSGVSIVVGSFCPKCTSIRLKEREDFIPWKLAGEVRYRGKQKYGWSEDVKVKNLPRKMLIFACITTNPYSVFKLGILSTGQYPKLLVGVYHFRILRNGPSTLL